MRIRLHVLQTIARLESIRLHDGICLPVCLLEENAVCWNVTWAASGVYICMMNLHARTGCCMTVFVLDSMGLTAATALTVCYHLCIHMGSSAWHNYVKICMCCCVEIVEPTQAALRHPVLHDGRNWNG